MTTRIYYRVSTDKQDFEMQEHAVLSLLTARGINIQDCVIYQDLGISGTTTKRPEYQRLLAEICDYDTIMVYEFSRLWRDMEEQSRATKVFFLMGVKVVSVADGELKDFNDKLSVGIKRVINEFEAQRLRQRTKAGIAAKKAKIAQGLDVWKPRGQDKEKRSSEGYVKEQARRRALKTEVLQNDKGAKNKSLPLLRFVPYKNNDTHTWYAMHKM